MARARNLTKRLENGRACDPPLSLLSSAVSYCVIRRIFHALEGLHDRWPWTLVMAGVAPSGVGTPRLVARVSACELSLACHSRLSYDREFAIAAARYLVRSTLYQIILIQPRLER